MTFKKITALILIVIVMSSITACSDYLPEFLTDNVDVENVEYSLEYQPPFSPVTFVIEDGDIKIVSGLSLVTPIGRFGLQADYPIAETNQVTLVIQDRTKQTSDVYHVSVEDDVRLLISGTSEIIFRHGSLVIDVTGGQVEAIRFTNDPTDNLADLRTDQVAGVSQSRTAKSKQVSVFQIDVDEEGKVDIQK
ncbi:MAG: hypothetical protein B6242_06005 [Anaerolineaceae bacterium 4572_78]|nr:MAG: hypothetical protein B6242_06005 [Anaerolineaceae bacterium 4572_78]